MKNDQWGCRVGFCSRGARVVVVGQKTEEGRRGSVYAAGVSCLFACLSIWDGFQPMTVEDVRTASPAFTQLCTTVMLTGRSGVWMDSGGTGSAIDDWLPGRYLRFVRLSVSLHHVPSVR